MEMKRTLSLGEEADDVPSVDDERHAIAMSKKAVAIAGLIPNDKHIPLFFVLITDDIPQRPFQHRPPHKTTTVHAVASSRPMRNQGT